MPVIRSETDACGNYAGIVCGMYGLTVIPPLTLKSGENDLPKEVCIGA